MTVATGTGSIALVVLFNAVINQGAAVPRWQALTALLGLLAASVMGLVAVFRRHERSWTVMVPTVLVSVVVANELLQGVLSLLGLGGE